MVAPSGQWRTRRLSAIPACQCGHCHRHSGVGHGLHRSLPKDSGLPLPLRIGTILCVQGAKPSRPGRWLAVPRWGCVAKPPILARNLRPGGSPGCLRGEQTRIADLKPP
eukprot:6473885-Amphidinium_carterae.2